MWTILKVFIEFVTIPLLFMFWFFGHEACGFLVSQPGFKGLYVMDANQNTKFYIPKCNPNSKNEPALAFPNLFLLEEMDIRLRNVIAIEMSQLE